jgi:hypothetical protein
MKRILFILITFVLFSFKTDNENLIKGRIIDQNNLPIPFTFIYENNTTNITYSDENGKFILIVNNEKPNLIISHKSYGKIDTTVNTIDSLIVVL